MELERYGVTVNAIAPAALTRMTENLGHGRRRRPRSKPEEFDPLDPGQHRADRRLAGQPRVRGHHRPRLQRPGRQHQRGRGLGGRARRQDKGDRWDPAELGKVVPDLVAKAAPNANMGGRRK